MFSVLYRKSKLSSRRIQVVKVLMSQMRQMSHQPTFIRRLDYKFQIQAAVSLTHTFPKLTAVVTRCAYLCIYSWNHRFISLSSRSVVSWVCVSTPDKVLLPLNVLSSDSTSFLFIYLACLGREQPSCLPSYLFGLFSHSTLKRRARAESW